MNENIRQTLLARVYDVAIESPLDYAYKLSHGTGAKVYFKREDLQPVHSFKLRGAYNKICQLSKKEKEKGVIAASAGNHAQGVALSAKKLSISAVIVMPTTTPGIKVEAVKSFGAEVVLFGDNFSDAYEYSKEIIKKTGRVFIHPFDDPLVIAGQGTIGRELLEQLPQTTHIFIPIGGGGLAAGIAQYVKQLRNDIKIIGVEPDDSNVMQASLKVKQRVKLDHVGIFADGVAVKQAGELTYKLCKQYLDEIITVSTDQICAGIKAVFEDTRAIVEPAGALASAGIMNYTLPDGAKAVAVCSGANLTFERLQQIAERTLLGSGKEVLFAVKMPETPGALAEFCKKIVNGHGITSFSYRLNDRNNANIFISLSIASEKDKDVFESKMKKFGYEYSDLADDDIAKDHVRHMIGGPAPNAQNEWYYIIEFPERPNALSYFLSTLSRKWNISAFHYRSQASDRGSVLIGFEAEYKSALESRLDKTGYSWESIDNSKSIKLFISSTD